MRRFLLAGLLLSMTIGSGVAGAATLDDLRWEYRVILIFVPTDTRAAEIRDTLENDIGIAERDIAWIILAPETTASNLGMRIDQDALIDYRENGGFEAVLIGKDGQVKARQTESLYLDSFYEKIDAMPMRQREMRQP